MDSCHKTEIAGATLGTQALQSNQIGSLCRDGEAALAYCPPATSRFACASVTRRGSNHAF